MMRNRNAVLYTISSLGRVSRMRCGATGVKHLILFVQTMNNLYANGVHWCGYPSILIQFSWFLLLIRRDS